MLKNELVSYLDAYLEHDQRTHDNSKNGLQIETTIQDIQKIGYAVDVTTYIIDRAIQEDIDLLITHHGLYRGYEQPLTGIMYQRVKRLIDNNIGLYTSHLPLDAHPQVGNNHGLIQARQRIFTLKNTTIQAWGTYKGKDIGYMLTSPIDIPIAGVLMPYCERMGLVKSLYNFGQKEAISSVAIITGSGGNHIQEVKELGIDLFITGEMVHHEITLAKELGQSILLGGHYETEKIGIKLLCHHLQKTWKNIQCIFLDEKY